MLLSKNQLSRFWRDWSAVARKNQWPPAEAETQRKALLSRAGFSSLTLVDKVAGFSRVLEELAILRDDLGALRRAEENPRRVLLHAIETYGRKISPSYVASAPFGNSYIGAIMIPRWGHMDIERLPDADLVMLRNTLADRLTQEHQPATQARRRATNRQRRQTAQDNPEARINLDPPAVSISSPTNEAEEMDTPVHALVPGPF